MNESNRVSEGTRLNEIELPPQRENNRDWKPPGWLIIAVLSVLTIGVVVLLTLTSAGNRTSAETTKSEALSVFDQIQQSCTSRPVPPQFAELCRETPGARDRVVAAAPSGLVGPAGSDGSPGRPGPPGVPGAPGAPGEAGARGSDGLSITGPAGEAGASGSDGLSVTGPPGAAGVAGPAGPAGPPGVAGPVGERGPVGPEGQRGPQGDPGSAGGFPDSYSIQHADGRTELCTRNAAPPPDYTCSFVN